MYGTPNSEVEREPAVSLLALWIESRLTFEKKVTSLDLKIIASCRIGSCCSKQKWFTNLPKYVHRLNKKLKSAVICEYVAEFSFLACAQLWFVVTTNMQLTDP